MYCARQLMRKYISLSLSSSHVELNGFKFLEIHLVAGHVRVHVARVHVVHDVVRVGVLKEKIRLIYMYRDFESKKD